VSRLLSSPAPLLEPLLLKPSDHLPAPTPPSRFEPMDPDRQAPVEHLPAPTPPSRFEPMDPDRHAGASGAPPSSHPSQLFYGRGVANPWSILQADLRSTIIRGGVCVGCFCKLIY
jgi:hypothetical protein